MMISPTIGSKKTIKPPNVFVSYTWESDEHKKWVRILAAKLREDGVNVILDQWETAPGDQLPEFMERAVRDNDFVLIICTQTYKQKSDQRVGGTGYEGDIMTGEVYITRNRRKFIPVLRSGDKKTAIPSWLEGAYFIDLKAGVNNRYYEDLVRTLFDKRQKAPALGTPPNYISDGFSSEQGRDVIFISHSSPDGDDFSRWLSMQLINQGYRVWCDLLRLKGGEEKQQIAELIKQRTGKFLFVHTPISDTNKSANEELQIAYDLMRREDISQFIIPLRLELVEHSTNTMLSNLTPIVFIENWAFGFRQLLENLALSGFVKSQDANPELSSFLWNKLYDPDGGVVEKPELYDSNWFPIVEFPSPVYFHTLQRKGSIGQITCGDHLPYPGVQHSIYLVSFASATEFNTNLPPDISISETTEVIFDEFLNGSYQSSQVLPDQSWNILTDILNQAWVTYIKGKGLGIHYLANRKICHYFKFGAGGDSRITFIDRDGKKAFRTLMGYKTVRTASGVKVKRYWHFGIQGKALLYPQLLFVIKPHVVFSDDGNMIWKSKARLHKARRSWCRLWWNDIWRGRLLASMSFLADGQDRINIPVGNGVAFVITSKPLLFNCPFTYSNPIDNPQMEEVDWDESPEELFDIDDATGEAGFSGDKDANG